MGGKEVAAATEGGQDCWGIGVYSVEQMLLVRGHGRNHNCISVSISNVSDPQIDVLEY